MRPNIGQGRANRQASIAKGPLGEASCYCSGRDLRRLPRRRDASGRLYASFDATVVTAAMRNATIVSGTEAVNQSSGKRVRRLIVQRAS